MKTTQQIPAVLGAAFLSAAVPTALQAVAVSPELLNQESRTIGDFHYAAVILFFVIGILIGAWVQKRSR